MQGQEGSTFPPSPCLSRAKPKCYLLLFLNSHPNSSSWSRWKSHPFSRDSLRASRALWRRILTLSTVRPRIPAISGLVKPSRSLRTRGTRYSSGRPSIKLRIHVFISFRTVMVSRDPFAGAAPSSLGNNSFSSALSVTESALKAALRNRSRRTFVAML